MDLTLFTDTRQADYSDSERDTFIHSTPGLEAAIEHAYDAIRAVPGHATTEIDLSLFDKEGEGAERQRDLEFMVDVPRDEALYGKFGEDYDLYCDAVRDVFLEAAVEEQNASLKAEGMDRYLHVSISY